MTNPSETGARGPAGPVAEPLKTGTAASSSVPPSATSAPETGAGGSRSSGARQESPSGGALSASLKETAQTAADAVRQQAVQFARDVGQELSMTGETQKARGVDAIRQFARAIDSAALELERQSPTVARTVREAARAVDGLSDNLSSRSVNELIDSAAALARAQPALFIGGSVAAGFALARFLKSSAPQRSGAGYDPYQR